MIYFKQEDFNKCMEFLADKPDTVETQQELYKFMHEECRMLPDMINITKKNMCVYSKVYATRLNPGTTNWCNTMSDGSQVVWNRKYQEFYMIDAVGTDRCDCINYLAMFPELKDINKWLLENWSNWRFQETQKQLIANWRFQETQKQLIAIWNGKYDENFKNWWR